MPKKESTIVNAILFVLDATVGTMMAFSPYELRSKILFGKNYHSYRNAAYNLQKRGSVKIVTKKRQKVFATHQKGPLGSFAGQGQNADRGEVGRQMEVNNF